MARTLIMHYAHGKQYYVGQILKHLKTGRQYKITAFAIDATNARDGGRVVVYSPVENEHEVYTRDWAEFTDGRFR